jgi:hypothetical protein
MLILGRSENNKRVMDSLQGQEEIKQTVPSYLSPYGPVDGDKK